MAVTPDEELLDAKERLKSDREIDHRQAASGAYYAALHALQNLVDMQGAAFRREGGTHAQVIDKLLASKDLSIKALGYMLKDCRGRRTDADYDMDKTFSKRQAQLQVDEVKKIFAKIVEIGHAELLKKAPAKLPS